jgi:hypothetical protein
MLEKGRQCMAIHTKYIGKGNARSKAVDQHINHRPRHVDSQLITRAWESQTDGLADP